MARGFYDRLPAARLAATQALQDVVEVLADGHAPAVQPGTSRVRDIALAHEVCPYDLTHELVRWADVEVGDCNHCFDGNALLRALTQANEWCVAVLVDEAHNLVERARAMYSANLDFLRIDSEQANTVLKHSGSALGAFYRRLCSRMDRPGANIATARKLARMVDFMLTRGEDLVDKGQQHGDGQLHQRSAAALKHRAAALGFEVKLTSVPA